MDENDWDGWKLLTERLGDKVQLVGMTCSLQILKSLKKESKRYW